MRDQVAEAIRHLVETQRVAPHHRILCYGCGAGADVAWLRARNFNVDGYDTYAPFGFATLPEGKYDWVFVVYLLRRLGNDTARRDALADAGGLLRPGGRLVVASRDAHRFAEAAGFAAPDDTPAYLAALCGETLFDQTASLGTTTEDGAFCFEARRGGLHRPQNPIHYADTQEAIAAACAALVDCPVIGLDVETTLDEPRTLCTVQLGTASETWVFDALALEDYTPLKTLLGDPGIEKVIHNALFEEQMLGKHGVRIANIFDTLPASRAKYKRGSVDGHHLGAVCERELGIYLDKTLQTSDWTQRPLSREQLDYAALDAEVLLTLHRVFKPPALPENLELFPLA